MRAAALLLAGLLAVAPSARAAGDVHLLVASGLPGEPQYGELFRRWAGDLVQTASDPSILGASTHLLYIGRKGDET